MYKVVVLFLCICIGCKEPVSFTGGSSPLPSYESSRPLTIQYGLSYAYDLQQEAYIVYFVNNTPDTIPFRFTEAEKKALAASWSAVRLHLPNRVFRIYDNCMDMPKIYTKTRVHTIHEEKEVVLDELCDDRKEYKQEAKAIQAFLDTVEAIIKRKPVVQEAPASDMIYM